MAKRRTVGRYVVNNSVWIFLFSMIAIYTWCPSFSSLTFVIVNMIRSLSLALRSAKAMATLFLFTTKTLLKKIKDQKELLRKLT